MKGDKSGDTPGTPAHPPVYQKQRPGQEAILKGDKIARHDGDPGTAPWHIFFASLRTSTVNFLGKIWC